RVAEVQEELRDPRHPDAADADEVDGHVAAAEHQAGTRSRRSACIPATISRAAPAPKEMDSRQSLGLIIARMRFAYRSLGIAGGLGALLAAAGCGSVASKQDGAAGAGGGAGSAGKGGAGGGAGGMAGAGGTPGAGGAGGPGDAAAEGPPATDAGSDTAAAACRPESPFGAPVLLTSVNSTAAEVF